MATFVLVHGAWCGGWVWRDVAAHLDKKGHRVEVIDQLPSGGPDPAVLADLQADAARVRQAVDALRGPVVLVGHSYGGMVITELADHPAVQHSVYIAAFWPPQGKSLLDLIADAAPFDWIVPREDGTLQITDDAEVAHRGLCADLEPQPAAAVHRQYVLQSMASLGSPSTAPARQHPTTYVICEQDAVIPATAQEAMAAPADHLVRLEAAHLAQMSHPDDVAEALACVVHQPG